MKKTSLFFLGFLLQTSLCQAWEIKQSPVSFVGTWAAESEALYLQAPESNTANSPWTQPKLVNTRSTIQITAQEGHRFWGLRTTDNQSPRPFIAIVDPTESTIVAVDQYGAIRGKVVNKNTFTYCYTHVPSKQDDLAYVECTVARRQNR